MLCCICEEVPHGYIAVESNVFMVLCEGCVATLAASNTVSLEPIYR